MSLDAVDPGATPEAWGKDWRWLCRARTTPVDVNTTAAATVGAVDSYHGGRCVYHGELVDRLPDGYGVLVFAQGLPLRRIAPSLSEPIAANTDWAKAPGCWFEIAGRFIDGRCAFASHDGAMFCGVLRDAIVTGNNALYRNGALAFPDGVRYTGEMMDDHFHGHGTVVRSNGSFYEGQWERGQKRGHGVNQFASGERHEGNFEYDTANGPRGPAGIGTRVHLKTAKCTDAASFSLPTACAMRAISNAIKDTVGAL